MYAVIDTETTGLSPDHRHRVIEIAVVLLDDRGGFQDEWVTLLNPRRDLGPQHIHGILTADVLAAPQFADVAPDLARRLAGRMLVGHNVAFDLDFLRAEFGRLGVTVPLITERSMCTMALAAYLYPAAPRSLGACCAAAGITLDGWHSALADTWATAELFRHYLGHFPSPPPWQWAHDEVSRLTWPDLPSSNPPSPAAPRPAAGSATGSASGSPAAGYDESPPWAGVDRFPPGSTVVLTGDMVEPREVWVARAVAAGFFPQDVVDPDTTFVVAADVDSLSVKGRAARDHGVPIISVDDFRYLLSRSETTT